MCSINVDDEMEEQEIFQFLLSFPFSFSNNSNCFSFQLSSPFNFIFNFNVQHKEDPRTPDLRKFSYGIILPIICTLGIVGNVLNLIVLTRRNMRGTAYIYMRGEWLASKWQWTPDTRNFTFSSQCPEEITCQIAEISVVFVLTDNIHGTTMMRMMMVEKSCLFFVTFLYTLFCAILLLLLCQTMSNQEVNLLLLYDLLLVIWREFSSSYSSSHTTCTLRRIHLLAYLVTTRKQSQALSFHFPLQWVE